VAETWAPAARPLGALLEEGSEAEAVAVEAEVAVVEAARTARAGAPEILGAEVIRFADEQHLKAAATEDVTATASRTLPSQPWTARHMWPPLHQGNPHAWAPATTHAA